MPHEKSRCAHDENQSLFWKWCSLTHVRHMTLAGTAILGTLGGAGFSSTLPCQFCSEAKLVCQPLAHSPVAPPVITEAIMKAAYERMGTAAGTVGDKVTTDVRIDHAGTCELTILAHAADPTHSQTLACTIAEIISEKRSGDHHADSHSATEAAMHAFEVADGKYRDALARLGERESKPSDPWVAPAGATEPESSEPQAPMMTTRAIVPASRVEEETLLQTAHRECMYRRNHLAELYTEEHPAVIALDRQIEHLKRQMAGGPSTAQPNVHLTSHDEAAADINAAAVEQLATDVESLKKARDAAWRAVDEAKLADHADGVDFAVVSPIKHGLTQYTGADRRGTFLITVLSVLSSCGLTEVVLRKKLAERAKARKTSG